MKKAILLAIIVAGAAFGQCGVNGVLIFNPISAQWDCTAAVAAGGVLGLANGGTGSDLSATGGTSQVLRQSSVGAVVTVSRLACADLSDSAAGCSSAGGTGTVTHTGGNLTNLSVMVGAGVADSKITNIVVDSGLNNLTLPATGVLTAPGGTASGSAPPSLTVGTGGADAYGEGTVPSVCAAAGVDCVYADSTAHALMASFNNGAYYKLTQTICSGTISLATGAISSGAKTSAATGSCTGLATTDNIMVDFNADPTAVTGYIPSVNGILTILKFPTADTVNVIVENNTGSSVTPGAITLNYRVTR